MSTQVITKKTISALRICYFTLSVSVAVYLPRIPDLKDKLHLTVGEIGQILMLVGLVGFIASRLVTLVIKKLTSRRAVLFGVPFMLVGSIIIGMTHEVNIFVGGLIITGFGGFILKTCLYTQSNNVRVMSGNNRVSGFSAISNAGSLFAILIGSIFLSLLSTTTYIISLQILMSIVFVLVHNHLTKLDIVRGDGDKAEAKLPWIWNDFLLPRLVLTRETQTLPLSTYLFYGQYSTQYGQAMAGLLLAVVPIIAFFLFLQKQFISGLSQGAVK